MGSLNLHSTRAQAFPPAEVAFVTVVAALIASHLHAVGEHLDLATQSRLPRTAMRHRSIICQARGIIMAVHEVHADQAFVVLLYRPAANAYFATQRLT